MGQWCLLGVAISHAFHDTGQGIAMQPGLAPAS